MKNALTISQRTWLESIRTSDSGGIGAIPAVSVARLASIVDSLLASHEELQEEVRELKGRIDDPDRGDYR
jgi:hypothetical protein